MQAYSAARDSGLFRLLFWRCNGSYDYVRALHPIDGDNGSAAASARAPSFQSLASARPRLGGARDLLAQRHNAREGWRNHVLVLFFVCSQSSAIILRWSLDDELTPLTHGCSRRFEDRRRVHQAYKYMAAIAERVVRRWRAEETAAWPAGAQRSGADSKTRGAAQPDGTTRETPSSDGARCRIHARTPQIPNAVRFLPPVHRGLEVGVWRLRIISPELSLRPNMRLKR